MDRKPVLIFAVVIASGCIHSSLPEDQVGPGTTQSSGQGLQIHRFTVSDKTINPSQTAVVTAELRNYHEREIDPEVSLYNTGVLQVERRGCSPEKLASWREGYVPRMECRWRIKVSKSDIQGFESKTIPAKLEVSYNSELSNAKQPVKIHFKPLSEITRTNEVKETFSNGEVRMKLETQSPIPSQGRPVTVTVNNAGPGRVEGSYSFSYTPKSLFSGCPSTKEPLVEQEASFTCDIKPGAGTSQTRNLIISTSYKYTKAPTLDIEVVNPQ